MNTTTTNRLRRPARLAIAAALSLAMAAAPVAMTGAAAAPIGGFANTGHTIAGGSAAVPFERVQSRRAFRGGRGYARGYRAGPRRVGPRRYSRGRGYRPYRRGGYYRPYYGGYYGGGNYAGAAAAAGIIGLAAGAIAGSALAAPRRRVIIQDGYYPAPYTGEWYRLCDQKYRSFRASDGTYLGYDGRRHVCRIP